MSTLVRYTFLFLVALFVVGCVDGASLSPAIVRAVFKIESNSGQLMTSEYTFCTAYEYNASVAEAYCSSGTGVRVQQSIAWNSMTPPGIYRRNLSTMGTAADAVSICAGYLCDMYSAIESQLSLATIALEAGTGGFSSAFPCSSCVNSTFILSTTNKTIVQTNVLPLAPVASAAAASLRADYCSGSTTCTTVCTLCLVRLVDPRYYVSAGTISGYDGDGSLLFPVKLSMCARSLSTILSYDDGSFLGDGYTALLTVEAHADSLSLPWELIRAIAAWIPQSAGSSTSLLRSGACVWAILASEKSAYRTGEYYTCQLDASLVGSLPPLSLSVDKGRILRSAGTPPYSESSCVFTLDLNELVEDGVLRLFSSGSVTAARRRVAAATYREPVLAIGVLLLKGDGRRHAQPCALHQRATAVAVDAAALSGRGARAHDGRVRVHAGGVLQPGARLLRASQSLR
ncbi:hypothetical protein STCU_10645 [Strigomonas culicis]|uniref:Uncharacterized protein n=1 Tax=Strigomonas culicis TaxID=28005 RepID=S9US16_9TRYP|nr:hypothetical protein STCU_10645 [Strigomonas culicis]|eukprot:EPY17396.1 hypothetical protein STCU_10645 [Strigomonas culicis]